MNSFKTSPALRAGVRAIVVAVITYFVSALTQGGGKIDDWHSFAWGVAGGVAYAILGLLTPVEPFVGVKAKVEVPTPPAIPTR